MPTRSGGLLKIIHLTDLHLPAVGKDLWGLDSYGRADAILTDIAEGHSDAAFMVITGDLTDGGDAGAFAWLWNRLQSLPFETVLMIGNHDDREAMRAALPNLPDDGQGFAQGIRDTAEGRFIFLDTFKGDGSAGLYCQARRQWLASRLAEHPGPHRIFMHHPPFDVGIPYMDRIKLEDAEAFADVLNGHDVRHIFFGHIHRPCVVSWQGITCTALPGTNHQVPLDRARTGTAYSVEPPMYGVVLIDGETTIVHMDAALDRSPADMP
ncbi:MAG: phosphodiesterase [Pseudomonadota bacterium]